MIGFMIFVLVIIRLEDRFKNGFRFKYKFEALVRKIFVIGNSDIVDIGWKLIDLLYVIQKWKECVMKSCCE